MKNVLPFCLLLFLPHAALAAAWTQPRGTWQMISGVILSDADTSFDAGGHAATPTFFDRVLLTTDTEYGLTNRLTFLARTETAYVRTRNGSSPAITATDNAFEGGVRFRLLRGLGILAKDDVLSVEASARKAGAFNFAYSANATAGGEDAGVRLLYGSGFRLGGRPGFVNLEAGERWLSRPRPDQSILDLTAGLWLNRRWMVMAQSFNLVSGPATAPYVPFRTHKLEVSAVWRMSRRFTLQAGAFFSPAGQNALDERGLCLSLWSDF
jgi:hypothetical protein